MFRVDEFMKIHDSHSVRYRNLNVHNVVDQRMPVMAVYTELWKLSKIKCTTFVLFSLRISNTAYTKVIVLDKCKYFKICYQALCFI